MQPLVAVVAPVTVEAYWPAGQVMFEQDVAAPPEEYEPCAHAVQPSVACIDPLAVAAYLPAAHVIFVQAVVAPPVE